MHSIPYGSPPRAAELHAHAGRGMNDGGHMGPPLPPVVTVVSSESAISTGKLADSLGGATRSGELATAY
jgi:hypothetical protein